ncbi:MAG: hypothetical protein HQL08_04185 [Nitrospirae bacterium]|nr:hypothetical protein [Nitrospirota bacterium]
MESPTEKNIDYIDLYDYWKVIVKRKTLIISIFLIAVISTAIISQLMPKVYKGTYIVKVPTKDSSLKELPMKEEVKGFNIDEVFGIIGKLDRESLKNILPKTGHLAAAIKVVAMAGSTDKIQLLIDACRADDVPLIASEFAEYLNNSYLIKNYVEQEKKMLTERSEELSVVIQNSAEMVKTYERLFKNGSLTAFGINPVEVNKSMSDLKHDKIMIDRALRDLKGAVIVGQPYVAAAAMSPKKLMALAAVCSLFFGILLAFIMEHKMNLKGRIS